MILIFSVSVEFSTCDVIDWLNYYGEPYLRINTDDGEKLKIEIILSNDNEKIILSYGTREIDLSKIKALWFRRGGNFQFFEGPLLTDIFTSKKVQKEIAKNIFYETKSVYDFIHFHLKESVPSIGNFQTSNVNKLEMLSKAIKAGLHIPKSKIVSSKKDLMKFKNQSGEIITKAIGENLHFLGDTHFYSVYTELIMDSDIKKFPEFFFPSLVQKKVEKKYEIRSFFLQGEIYSMAIFSQNNEQTAIDFRKYDEVKPNRNVPYLLPFDIEQRIRTLMKSLSLNTGSLDLIYSQDERYIFLEVNPVGQFGMVSSPCNYSLDKKIALNLIQQ